MIQQLGHLDILVFLGLIAFLFIASYSKPKSSDAEAYFMASRSLRWWSVAGSIFGTNIHAQQIIGMMGIGYSIGFAQSNYEVWAVVAILVMAYVFVPIYRKRNFFTLSEFLETRYAAHTRLLYSIIMLIYILIQLVAAFYIGSRTLIFLFQGSEINISYTIGLMFIGIVTLFFSILGGMSSVVTADNILTVVMILALVLLGFLIYAQPEINGFSGLLKIDAALAQKMHLFLPNHHPDLPTAGIFTGLTILNLFYWTTNQYQVQRILAAKTEYDAKLGSILAGFLKLIIPFFSIAVGIAAFYIFNSRFGENNIKPDDVFVSLLIHIVPNGLGIKGLILAGLLFAIFSAIYSMMNSVSTMVAIDIMKKYIRPDATDRESVWYGRISIFVFIVLAFMLASFTYDPSASTNFFLIIAKQTSYIKPGLVLVFFWGVFWAKTNAKAATFTLIAAPFIGIFCDYSYVHYLSKIDFIVNNFGKELNFLYRVFAISLLGSILIYALSKILKEGQEKSNFTKEIVESSLDFMRPLAFIFLAISPIICLNYFDIISTAVASSLAFTLVFLAFNILRKIKKSPRSFFLDDYTYAGLLAATMTGIMFYFA
jgi:solute:Na+ symporter, SSS family